MEPLLRRLLAQFPVVVLTGARQSGKSTLAQHLDSASVRRYLSLDLLGDLEKATRDPHAFIDEPPGDLTLDEVQRVPELFLAIKYSVDRDRRPGRFLLTGSANPLLMRSVSESLAGRAVYLALGPMTEREKKRREPSGFWDLLSRAKDVLEVVRGIGRGEEGSPWQRAVLEGGLPLAAFDAPEGRARWLDGYVQSYLERDLRHHTQVENLGDFRRFMRMAALRTGQVLGQAALARDAAVSSATAHRWLNLMEITYQVLRLPSYHVNRTKRLIRSPKLYWGDTGVGAFLAEVRDEEGMGGGWLENLILVQALAWRETQVPKPEVCYWRTAAGQEVDFVLEWRRRLVPVEVKASVRVHAADARSLESFLGEYPDLAPFGVLLHAGKEAYRLSDKVVAVPLGAVL